VLFLTDAARYPHYAIVHMGWTPRAKGSPGLTARLMRPRQVAELPDSLGLRFARPWRVLLLTRVA